MMLLDTGYLIALFDARDGLHDRAVAWSEAVNEPLLVTEYVLWETVNAFSQPADRAKAHSLAALVFDQDFEQAGFEALLRRDPPLGSS